MRRLKDENFDKQRNKAQKTIRILKANQN